MMMSTEIRNEIRRRNFVDCGNDYYNEDDGAGLFLAQLFGLVVSFIILGGLITWTIFQYLAYDSGTNAYYGIKHLIMPAQVKCTVKQVEEGEFDVLIVNRETNEGTLYKGLQEINVSNVLENLPKGKYYVLSNARIIVDYRSIDISEIPSEWKEFVSTNIIEKNSVIEWIEVPVSRWSSWHLGKYTSVNE